MNNHIKDNYIINLRTIIKLASKDIKINWTFLTMIKDKKKIQTQKTTSILKYHINILAINQKTEIYMNFIKSA